MIKANYHTHSCYCDGKETPQQYVEMAIAKGFTHIGFSGHAPVPFENTFAISAEKYSEYCSEIRQLKERYSHKIKISLGYSISFEPMASDAAPVVITQNEFMRRMKEMAKMSGGGMSQFYGQMPDNFTIAVNGNHPIVIDILGDVEREYGDKLKSITKKIDAAEAEERRFDETVKGKKEEDFSQEEKEMAEQLSKKIITLRDERNERLKEIGRENKLVRQIIDLALLSNGMLKGKNLSDFIQRSITLIEK